MIGRVQGGTTAEAFSDAWAFKIRALGLVLSGKRSNHMIVKARGGYFDASW